MTDLTPIEKEALRYRKADWKKVTVSSILKSKGELDRTAINKYRRTVNNVKGAKALGVATPEQLQEANTASFEAGKLQKEFNAKFKSELDARKTAVDEIKIANSRMDIMFEAVGIDVYTEAKKLNESQ